MNTCKAAMRILKARKLYVIIYLVLIGTMMLSISWQIMRGLQLPDRRRMSRKQPVSQ